MAISITNSQGSKLYVGATAGADVSTVAAIGSAITAGEQVGCLQDLGAIGSSRAVQAYGCLSTDDTAKAGGSLSLGNVSVSMLFNAADAAGQAALRTIYASNATRTIIVELSDGSASPTYITFEGFVSGQEVSIQKDSAVMITSTVEIASNPVITDAV